MFGLTPFKRNFDINRRGYELWDFGGFLENFFNDSFIPAIYNNSTYMNVDIKEYENEYVVKAELPGVKKEEINIEVSDDMLTIAVKRNEFLDIRKDNYIRKEHRDCSMYRSFYVKNVNTENVHAKFDNGLLTIVLPKKRRDKVNFGRIRID
jgi:HSP20 family protein